MDKKVDLLYLFLYKRLRDKFKTNQITLKQLKEFLSLDYSVNHLCPKFAHKELIEELTNDFDILKKQSLSEFEILDRRDLLKRIIKMQINY